MISLLNVPGDNQARAHISDKIRSHKIRPGRIKDVVRHLFCEGGQMNTQELLLDTNVIDKLVNDLGIENARKFMESLDTEFQKRIDNLRQAIEDRSYYQVP